MAITLNTENRVTTLSIDRPEARNAVDPATGAEIYQAALDFEQDGSSDVLILTGDRSAFCAGFDLKSAAKGLDDSWRKRFAIPEGWTDPVLHPLPSPMGPARLMLSKPVIAAIEGAAVAGGMELALWCDVRIMARSAFFGVFCRRWGVPLIDGGTVRLPRIVGDGRANDLILTGRAVSAEEAFGIGLANRITEDGQALSEAQSYAENLTRFPQACLRADMTSARLAPADLATALRREWQSTEVVLSEALKGATRFAGGKGRGGDFGDI
jgi:enoyl-CoA hydratase/carnithine racemase